MEAENVLTSSSVEMNEEQNENETETMEDKIAEPKIDMMFDSLEEVLDYYTSYGKQQGFAVCKRSSQRSLDDGRVIHGTFACSQQGKSKSNRKNTLRRYLIKKTGCQAKLHATLCSSGKWRISSIVLDHNHVLTPGKSRYYRCNRVVQSHGNRKLELNDTTVQNFFMKMQMSNSDFFYMMDLDEKGRLKNVFWADARSRAAYEEFGDVITFDTTHLTNKYDMPLASFIGVNHHGQSILLGCGLIASEDTNTFTWLFRSWLTCMFGRTPAAIITDQDTAIQNAIKVVFPNACHRWCLWHIMKKLPEKLKRYNKYKQIKFALQNAVYDSLTPLEFEESWNWMIEKFKLDTNDWLTGLYDERRRWVPAFVKDSFWAGMSPIGRNDSVHVFFDGYVNSKTTLKQFVEQYENILRSKAKKEKREDVNSRNSCVQCVTHYDMEKQLQDAYTITKFREFQHELTGKMYCELSLVKETGTISEYEVSEDIKVGESPKRVNFNVFFIKVESGEECEVKCSCRLFEFGGILCRHAISVLIHKEIDYIPAKYILQRWRKDLRRRHTRVKISYDDWSAKPEGRRFDKICNAFHNSAYLAIESEDKCNMVMDWLHELEEEIRRNERICQISQPIPRSNSDWCSAGESGGISKESQNVLNPLAVHGTGCPPFKRKLPKVDQIVKKKKVKKRTMESNGKKTSERKGKKDSQIIENEKIDNHSDRAIDQVAVIPTQESIVITDSQITQNVHVHRSDGHHPSMLQFHNVPLHMGMPQLPIGMSMFQQESSRFARQHLYFGQGSQGSYQMDLDSAPENLVFSRTDALYDSYSKSGNQ